MRFLPFAILFSFGFAVLATAAPSKGQWSCSASGHQPTSFPGGIGQRITVNGPFKPTEPEARMAALQACTSMALQFCSVSSCSKLPF